jgi:predicted alpha/beta superfamily hydrolase
MCIMRTTILILLATLFMTACKEPIKKDAKEKEPPVRESTKASNVHIIDTAFYMPQLNRHRRIWIYLPPDYEQSSTHYPVLYMHDGQNLFDDLTSFSGEWGVDETLNDMARKGFPGIIVVGIDNGSEERLNEYSPWQRKDGMGGLGEKYAAFLVETLKPAIDHHFRTIPQSRYTGIGGSSMGGLISMYATLKYPDVFGRSLIFSPAFWFEEENIGFAKKSNINPDFKMYFLAGGMEHPERSIPTDTQKMIDILKANGLAEHQYRFVVDPKGKHNEALWKKHFRDAIEFLYNQNTK